MIIMWVKKLSKQQKEKGIATQSQIPPPFFFGHAKIPGPGIKPAPQQ